MPEPDSIVPLLEAPPTELHRWSRREFEELVAAGIIEEGSRLELLDGIVIDMPVQNPAHYRALRKVALELERIFGMGYDVRQQAPLALDEFSAPEPDLAVVEGSMDDFRDSHPSRALLIVEVSDTSLAKDRGPKLRAYARAGIPEYWILNLPARQLELHRRPEGEGYQERRVLTPADSIAPEIRPSDEIAVEALFS